MTTKGLRAAAKAPCLRLLVFLSAALLSASAVVHGQDGNGKPEEAILKNLQFRSIGPANMGGRIDDFAVVENNPSIFYVGAATGAFGRRPTTARLSIRSSMMQGQIRSATSRLPPPTRTSCG